MGSSGNILTSSDGVNWTERSSVTPASFNGITYGNNNFVAVGLSGAIITSTDGINWI